MNSSSSSSDCYCDDCFSYGVDQRVDSNTRSHRRVSRHPFFYNTTQPLVYYAQIPPLCKRPRSREIRKESPNCFVKAFKWYTREHIPPQRNQFSTFNPDITGFAEWLDIKYQQFVRESSPDDSHFLKLQQTSSLEGFKTIKETKSKPKKKSRLQSPWRKRQNPHKEGGDMSQKSHHSFEYIMQPKEITRNVSEWCQPTPTFLRNRSNVTIVSTEICNCKKPATKSLSLTSVHQENKSNATFVTKEVVDEKKVTNFWSKFARTGKARNISCQCVTDVTSKITSETQYEDPVVNSTNPEQEETKTKLVTGQVCQVNSSNIEVIIRSFEEMPKKGTVKKIVQEFDPRRHISCQCTEEVSTMDGSCQCDTNINTWSSNNGSQQTTSPIVKHTSCSSKQVKSALTNTANGSNSFKKCIHSAMQTSDHPINLDNDLIQQYPFFMRIVCADKLCDDCINR